jgi:hypothetical protein
MCVDRWHDASAYVYLSILLFAQTMEDFMLHGCFPSKVRTFFFVSGGVFVDVCLHLN